MKYFCCDELRKKQLQGQTALNGIDFLEVLDDLSLPEKRRQRILFVHFLSENGLDSLKRANVRIEGGDRIRDIAVEWVRVGDSISDLSEEQLSAQEKAFLPSSGDLGKVLIVRTDSSGDFSTYTLRIVNATSPAPDKRPPDGFDPILSAIEFSFKVHCFSEFDCLAKRVCPDKHVPKPDINYLARDYASFRQLMLDRITGLSPGWKEKNAADGGVALVELLAYVGDHLSYEQDAVGTEAYLGTARRRVSVKRHARLVDYFMHDGCNARTWVHVTLKPGVVGAVKLPEKTPFLTEIAGMPVCTPPSEFVPQKALAGSWVVFESMHEAVLFQAHNEMSFYTWGDTRCCLPAGATTATLDGHFPDLKAGDVLIFEEIVNPTTNVPEDADAGHRHAVRLTDVKCWEAANEKLKDPLYDALVTEIQWHVEDALPFPLCVSSVTDEEHGKVPVSRSSVALGNIVLADHGLTQREERIKDGTADCVPPLAQAYRARQGSDRCQDVKPGTRPPRYRPALHEIPLTFSAAYEASESAARAGRVDLGSARPAVCLEVRGDPEGTRWFPGQDLLDSNPEDRVFVVDVEENGTAGIRFGDDRYGAFPEPELKFDAIYRVGNGVSGNIGADTLKHVVIGGLPGEAIEKVRNPLAAVGGTDPEDIEVVRQRAPFAFRHQERAVTLEDYAEMARKHPQVQNAVGTFRWTGSWHTVFLTVDRKKGLKVDADFRREMRSFLERYRLAGYDIVIDGPRYVSLEIEMLVCARPGVFREDVKKAMLDALSNRQLPDGRLGAFHPDNLTFGQTVYLSRIYQAALAVDGVRSVTVRKFRRLGTKSTEALDAGKLVLGRLEIARLDNDPNFPDHGILEISMGGGQ